jgi:sugar transferase (PEP-CTERM/EpsH1 system associated)
VRTLFLTHRLPYAPNRGDRIRAYHLLHHLRTYTDIDLLSLVHDDDEAGHASDLESLVSTVHVVRVPNVRNLVRSVAALPSEQPLTHTMLDGPGLMPTLNAMLRAHPPTVVLAYCSGMARLGLHPVLRDLPFVVDMVDVDSAKWAALATAGPPPKSWIYAREARVLSRFERVAAQHAFATCVVTEGERDTLSTIAPDARIEIVQNGVDGEGLRPRDAPGNEPRVVFCGVMNYPPNVAAAVWIAREIWPLVRQRRPDASLQLVGSNPTRTVQRLASESSGITVTGEVSDVRPYLWRGAVAAAPLLTARGVQNKVLEAVAAGLPVVVTPVVLRGVPREVQPACLTARDTREFADALVKLLDMSPAARRALAATANLDALTWDRTLGPVRGILEEAASAQSRSA